MGNGSVSLAQIDKSCGKGTNLGMKLQLSPKKICLGTEISGAAEIIQF